jgi:DNA-binding transcriptional LysR family regulator
VDLILMNLPVDAPDLVQDPLWRYEMVFVVPSEDPAAKKATVSAEELSTRSFICISGRW